MKNKSINSILIIVLVCIFFSCGKDEGRSLEPSTKPYLTGTVDTTLTIYSDEMDRLVHYSVYYPAGYDTSKIDYPVLYFLHGAGGNHRDLVDYGVAEIQDNYVYREISKPMVIIMPQAFNSFYVNCGVFECLPYEDFLINEFFPHVETQIRIKTEKENTAITGASMGGYGATYLSFKYQDKFGSAYSMFGGLLPGVNDTEGQQGMLLNVINSKTEEQLKSLPEYAMEVGTEDASFIIEGNDNFDALLNLKEIKHTYIKREGSHTLEFAKSIFPKVLKLASKHFD